VKRILTPNPLDEDSKFEQAFCLLTEDHAFWTHRLPKATNFDCNIIEALVKEGHTPTWRLTTDTKTGKVIESVPLTRALCADVSVPVDLQAPLPEKADITTKVWYGEAELPEKDPKLRRNLRKGIQTAAAILLLEAVTFMNCASQWSGHWTQRYYGTGQADLWEVCGTHGKVTETAWLQGWRPLEPLYTAHFTDSTKDYIKWTLEDRAPRLTVIESPAKFWTYNVTQPLNATRTREKKLREKVTPFLEIANEIINKQLEDKHDFVLEIPNNSMQTHKLVKSLIVKPENFIGITNRRTFITSAEAIADSIHEAKPLTMSKQLPTSVANRIMIGFARHLQLHEPERLQNLVRALDRRVRATQMWTHDTLLEMHETFGFNSSIF
jgi:hypothetical protein